MYMVGMSRFVGGSLYAALGLEDLNPSDDDLLTVLQANVTKSQKIF